MELWYSHKNNVLSEDEKADMIRKAEIAYEDFMEALKIDRDDPNAKDTPRRVAKMLVNELFGGRYTEQPKVTAFPNDEEYDGIVFTNCKTTSVCAHHHLPFQCQIYMGVIVPPDKNSKVIGLSKYTRIAEWLAARPTIQETLTQQLHDTLNDLCKGNTGVMVYIIGAHACCNSRGVKQPNGRMITSSCSGLFRANVSVKNEFIEMVKDVRNGE